MNSCLFLLPYRSRRVFGRSTNKKRTERPKRENSRHLRGIEPLERRIAPATLVSANVIAYHDLDGNGVMVTFSQPLFDPAKSIAENHLNDIFKFSNGSSAVAFESGEPQQLQLIDLTQVLTVTVNGVSTNAASGTSINIKAAQGEVTKVGAINATGLVLDTVHVGGDLGQIDVGVASSKVALHALKVRSLFQFGNVTQLPGTSPADALESQITGKVGMVWVRVGLFGYLHAVDGTSRLHGEVVTTAPAKMGIVNVGSLVGDPATAPAGNHSGSIESAGAIGSVTVYGSLNGGGGIQSGSIVAENIDKVRTLGPLFGGSGLASGSIMVRGDLASVKIGLSGQFAEDGMNGGTGENSGSILVNDHLGVAKIIGGITGGRAVGSGLLASGRTMGTVTVWGDVSGNDPHAGGISAGGNLGSLSVAGNLQGGSGTHSGFVEGLKDIGRVRFYGDVIGGAGFDSGKISANGNLSRIVVGRLIGGDGANSGSIFAATAPSTSGTLGVVKVKGGVAGGNNVNAGSIISQGSIGSATIGVARDALTTADLAGGTAQFTGVILASRAIGSVKVTGGVLGADGDGSGSIWGTGSIAAVSIDGPLAGGAGNSSGTIIAHDARVEQQTGPAGDLGTVTIAGDITGGAGLRSGRVSADGNLVALTAFSLRSGEGVGGGAIETGLGSVHPGDARTITLLGTMTSTSATANPAITIGGGLGALTVGGITDGAVRVGADLGAVTILGDVRGSVISARGQAIPAELDLAIGSITVRGDVTDSRLLAGYDLTGAPVNADASIGRVKVISDWTASDLVAGVQDPAGDGFGNADDAAISGGTDRSRRISQIAGVVIKGFIQGTVAPGDHFGFVAQQILAFANGSTGLPLDPAVVGQTFDVGQTGDVTVREVPIA